MADILEPQDITEQNLANNGVTVNQFGDPRIMSLKGYFNNHDTSIDEDEALKFIYEYYDRVGANTMVDVLLNLKAVEARIGITQLGQSRILAVRDYLKIDDQIKRLTEAKSAYER